MLTRPRGSRKATLVSFAVALNVLNKSAKDSALGLPMVEAVTACVPFRDAFEEADALKRPAHAFGVDQALGGGEVTFASAASSVDAGVESGSVFTVVVACGWGSSGAFSRLDFGDFGSVLGIAGIMGTADRAGLGATGVVSPGGATEGCCADEGVVGFVESFSERG